MTHEFYLSAELVLAFSFFFGFSTVFSSTRSSRIIVTWLVLFFNGDTNPLPVGLNLLYVGPWSTTIFFIYKDSSLFEKLCLALAIAVFKSLCTAGAARLGENCSCLFACSTSIPLTKSLTSLTFRGDMRRYLSF